MRAFFLKVILTALSVYLLYALVILYVRSPISAEYWVPEMIVVKKYLCKSKHSPKVIILGGSNVLYNIDAGLVGKALKIPCFNFGLHAGMRLDWLLTIGSEVARSGDTIVLALEPTYYINGREWGEWRLRNGLAWRQKEMEQLALGDQLNALFKGGTLDLAVELVREKFILMMSGSPPQYLLPRFAALQPDDAIIECFKASDASHPFPFYQEIDESGTVIQTDESHWKGPFVPVTIPCSIDPDSKKLMTTFIDKMKNRGVGVYFANIPYGMDAPPVESWVKSEREFRQETIEMGSEVIESRGDLFFPRSLFFNTDLHMTSKGKQARTKILISALRKKGIGARE